MLRLFRKLMIDGRKHFQADLAEYLQCSPQTVIRLAGEIETVIGASLEYGLENRRRWYQIRAVPRGSLGLEFEELRYLAICRDLAGDSLPEQVRQRVDSTIFSLSLLMADHDYAQREKAQKQQFSFFSKGRIDYTPHFEHIEKLLNAAENRLVCLVQYKAMGKTESKEHRFAPGRIIAMNGALYALGASLNQNFSEQHGLINLAVHRIQSVVLTQKQHKLAVPDTDPQAFGLPWHEPRSFKIKFKAGRAAEYVQERIWAEEQVFEESKDGGLILHITTRSEPELVAWVRSFGEDAEIVENA